MQQHLRNITAEKLARTLNIQRLHQMTRAFSKNRKMAGCERPKSVVMSEKEFFAKFIVTDL
jgi:hypothetical protein